MSQRSAEELPLPALILQLWHDQIRLYEKQFGMSQSRLTLLRELRQTGEISQAELVQRLEMEGTLVTRFVKQMEGSGLLTRRSDPRDNRFTLVVLTPAGEDIARKMSAFTRTLEAQMLEGLSEEMRATIRQGLEHAQKRYAYLKAKAVDHPTSPFPDDTL